MLPPFESILDAGSCCGPNLRLIGPRLKKGTRVSLLDRDKPAMEYGAERLSRLKPEMYQRDVTESLWWEGVPQHDVVISCWLLSEIGLDLVPYALVGLRSIARKVLICLEPEGIDLESSGWNWQALPGVRWGVPA